MAEYVHGELKRRVGEKCPGSLEELVRAINTSWHEIPQKLLNNYVKGFRSKLKRAQAAAPY